MIVYSHRFQGVLQQVVLDLGLDLSLSDANSPVSLEANAQMLSDLTAMMNIDLATTTANGQTTYTFRKRA